MAVYTGQKLGTPALSIAARAAITAVHGYVPPDVLTNADLARMVDTTDAWITERTGIKERHILKGQGMGTSHMGAEAVRGLLSKTNTRPEEVELLICATTTPDFVHPCTANLICDMVGIRNIGSFDVQAACSGFLYALTAARQFIAAGTYKKIIVVGADKMSAIVDYTDRATCVLFGDGAAAVMLEPNTDYGIMDTVLRSDGSGMKYLHQKAGGSRSSGRCASLQIRRRRHDGGDPRYHGTQQSERRHDRLGRSAPGQPAYHCDYGGAPWFTARKNHVYASEIRQYHHRDHTALPVGLRAENEDRRPPAVSGVRRRLHLGRRLCHLGL
jgi:hypothetical protein